MVRRSLILALPLATVLVWGEKPPKPGPAVIAGTVFREPGFALAGAEIDLQPEPGPEASNKRKIKPMKVHSDSRGEFSFRVPAVAMRYTVRVRATGYLEEKKAVTIQGEERQDVFVTLKASKESAQ